MKATLVRTDLARALDAVRPAIATRPTHPILSAVVLAVGDDTLTLTGTNHELTIIRSLDATKTSSGRVLVSGHKIRDLVAKFTSPTVALEIDGSVLLVRSGGSSYQLSLMPDGEYPDTAELPARVGEIPAGGVDAATKALQHAVSTDPTLAGIFGVVLEADAGRLWCSCTDRFRFAGHPIAYTGEDFVARIDMASLIAARTLDGPVTLHADDTTVAFVTDTATLIVRQLAPAGFRWRAFLEIEPEFTFAINCTELSAALDRCLLVAERNTPAHIDISHGLMKITAGGDQAVGAEEVPADGDDEASLAINPRFLRELIACLGTESLSFGARTDPKKPLVIHALTGDGPSDSTHVLMPTRK